MERARIVSSALARLDTGDVQRVARETFIPERTVWRYRAGATLPPDRRLDRLEEALGIRPPRVEDVEPEV